MIKDNDGSVKFLLKQAGILDKPQFLIIKFIDKTLKVRFDVFFLIAKNE